jgi:hypothetical protein
MKNHIWVIEYNYSVDTKRGKKKWIPLITKVGLSKEVIKFFFEDIKNSGLDVKLYRIKKYISED